MKDFSEYISEKLKLSKDTQSVSHLSSNISDLESIWDKVDIGNATNADILQDSWVEEQYCNDFNIDVNTFQWDNKFYDYCIGEFKKQLKSNKDKFEQNDDNLIRIERDMMHKNDDIPEKVDIKWSFGKAANMFDRDVFGQTIHLEGWVKPENVNWADTIVHYLIDPQETTIYIKEHIEVEVELITDLKTKKEILSGSRLIKTEDLSD